MNEDQQNVRRTSFQPIRLERVSEKVAVQLRKVIGEGVFKIGDRLPAERELAEQMGVSRPSVREALQMLEMQGMIETVHGGGSIVKNITEQEIRSPMEVILEQDRERVLELAEVRSCLESWAARKAAEKRSEQELENIQRYLNEMEKDFLEGRVRFEVDLKFHTEIAAATHNTIFVHIIESIYQLIIYSIKIHREHVFTTKESQEKILDHHRRIFNSIKAMDPEAAEEAMAEHLSFVISEFREWSSQ